MGSGYGDSGAHPLVPWANDATSHVLVGAAGVMVGVDRSDSMSVTVKRLCCAAR